MEHNPTHSAYEPEKVNWRAVSWVFIVFAVLGFYTAMGHDSRTVSEEKYSTTTHNDTVAPNGEMPIPIFSEEIYTSETSKEVLRIGPISTQRKNEVFRVSASMFPTTGSWTYLEFELLDAEGEYLFSFGKELWAEDGYEGGSYWYESDRTYSTKLTIPEKGEYYISMKAESGTQQVSQNIDVKLARLHGSSLPYYIYAILVSMVACALRFLNPKKKSKKNTRRKTP